MVLGMKKNRLENYRPIVRAEVTTEESGDVIVPDSWPDAEKICACGCVAMIRSKESSPGRARISGSSKATLIYSAEDGTVKSMSTVLPYSVEMGDPAITESSIIVACPRVVSCEGRVLNSRKLQVRATIAVYAVIYNKEEYIYCNELESEQNLEVKTIECQALLTKEIREKNFAVSDELSLENGKPDFAEVLLSNAALDVTDIKMVGSKLVFKADANVSVVYLSNDGIPESAQFQLPFSQIVDLDNCDEQDTPELCLMLTGYELQIADDYSENLRSIDLNMNILAQASVSGTADICAVSDFYCPMYESKADNQRLELTSLLDRQKVSRQVQDRITVDSQPAKALMVNSAMTKTENSNESGIEKARQTIEASVIYLDSDGSIKTGKKKLEAGAELPLNASADAKTSCKLTQQITATVSGNTIQLGGNLEFEFLCTSKETLDVLTEGEIADQPTEKGNSPSAVVIKNDGDLWQLCKKYGARQADVLAVNGEISEGGNKMLLIPRASMNKA